MLALVSLSYVVVEVSNDLLFVELFVLQNSLDVAMQNSCVHAILEEQPYGLRIVFKVTFG